LALNSECVFIAAISENAAAAHEIRRPNREYARRTVDLLRNLEPVFIDEIGVFPVDFPPAFVTVKLVYPLSTRRFPLPCRTENHRENSPVPLMNTGSKAVVCAENRSFLNFAFGRPRAPMPR
jgi:hypothetical protein